MQFLKEKKNIFIVLGILLVALVAFLLDRDNLMKKTYESLIMDCPETINVEYGSKFNALDHIKTEFKDVELIGEVNPNEVGTYDLSYRITDTTPRYDIEIERIYDTVVEVKDTNKPVIELEKEEVRIYTNSDYDVNTENIISISDVVDGEIKEFEIETDLDLSNAGEYNVKVIAKDKNGLEESADYSIKVVNRPRVSGGNYGEVFDYLTGTLGYSRAAAAGICANIRFESNFNPGADSGTYFGLCQWGGGRRSNLFAWCESNGYDPYSTVGQLQYMQHELETSYTGTLNSLRSVDDSADGAYNAAVIFCRGFEGAATDAGRGDLGASYY